MFENLFVLQEEKDKPEEMSINDDLFAHTRNDIINSQENSSGLRKTRKLAKLIALNLGVKPLEPLESSPHCKRAK